MESLCSKGYGTSRIYLGLRAMRFLVFYLSLILAKGDDCARECQRKDADHGGDGTGARVRQSLIHK
ncbi:unnamed protein product [Brassica rapa subsp. narinosa]